MGAIVHNDVRKARAPLAALLLPPHREPIEQLSQRARCGRGTVLPGRGRTAAALARRIVQAIVGVAHELDIETIAEGVEDQATLEELRRIGVDNVQGYYVGRPGPLPQRWGKPKERPVSGTAAALPAVHPDESPPRSTA